MITLLTGENNFEITRKIRELSSNFDGPVERVDGSELELWQLPDLLMGATLFTDKRLVVIKNLSDNKPLWQSLETKLEQLNSDSHIVLVEPKLDKRTKTYKLLQQHADVHEYNVWTEKDAAKAEQWVQQEAERLGLQLDKASVHTLVGRVGVDQWLLYQALEKLTVVETVSPTVIENLIEARPIENVFQLFEAALKGDTTKLKKMLTTLETTEDPYRLFGLLSGQAIQLVFLANTDKASADVAKDIGVHPFVLTKLTPYVKHLGKAKVKQVVGIVAEADSAMKTSAGEPWLLIERALIKIACL